MTREQKRMKRQELFWIFLITVFIAGTFFFGIGVGLWMSGL